MNLRLDELVISLVVSKTLMFTDSVSVSLLRVDSKGINLGWGLILNISAVSRRQFVRHLSVLQLKTLIFTDSVSVSLLRVDSKGINLGW